MWPVSTSCSTSLPSACAERASASPPASAAAAAAASEANTAGPLLLSPAAVAAARDLTSLAPALAPAPVLADCGDWLSAGASPSPLLLPPLPKRAEAEAGDVIEDPLPPALPPADDGDDAPDSDSGGGSRKAAAPAVACAATGPAAPRLSGDPPLPPAPPSARLDGRRTGEPPDLRVGETDLRVGECALRGGEPDVGRSDGVWKKDDASDGDASGPSPGELR